jgi:hypothetical protein
LVSSAANVASLREAFGDSALLQGAVKTNGMALGIIRFDRIAVACLGSWTRPTTARRGYQAHRLQAFGG